MIEPNLDSAVFNDATVEEVISRMLNRVAKRFKNDRKQAMATDTHTGRIYSRGGGAGFRHYHQASARGQSPAIDTFNLTNSLKDEKTAGLSHRVYVDDLQAPYGKYLQDPDILDRPIATLEQAEVFLETPEARNEIEQCRQELCSPGGISVFATTRVSGI
jgi:hypothetical protein